MNEAVGIFIAVALAIAYFEIRLGNSMPGPWEPPAKPPGTPAATPLKSGKVRLDATNSAGTPAVKDNSVTLMTDERDERILGGEE